MQSHNNTDPSLKYIERKNDAISLLQELAKKMQIARLYFKKDC